MSTLFGNSPSGNGDGNSGAGKDRKLLFPSRDPIVSNRPGEKDDGAAASGTSGILRSFAVNPEQKPVFPRRDPASSVGTPATPPRAPLFPPRENREPLFPGGRTGRKSGEPPVRRCFPRAKPGRRFFLPGYLHTFISASGDVWPGDGWFGESGQTSVSAP